MENNSSLDPLGPEFGKVNAPAINTQSMSPFEGDTPRDNKIDYFSAAPKLSSTHPNYIIQDGVTGHAPGIPSSKNPRKNLSPNELKDAINKSVQMNVATHRSKNEYLSVNAYNAGPSGNSFYKRYAAYGQKKFDEVGFSPLRDNEAMYNAHTTMGDDFSRMMKNSFMPLLGRGFVSGPKSLIKMMQGDLSADLDDARAYENAAAIGQSSKKGMGAFFNNTAMSFAYTAGIIGESILEEAAGALLAPITGGGSFFAATANNARKIGKIGSAFDTAMDGYKAVNTTLKEANNINGARKMWKAAENIGANKVVKFLNPLENTFDAAVGIGKNADNLTGLARLAQGTSKTAGGLFRDVRNINMALSEARLEGGMNDNAVYDKAYDAFYKKNNRAPNEDEQYQMTKTAKEAGMNTLMWNTALIFASNKVVIPNLLKSGVSKRALQSKVDDVLNLKGGKVTFEKTVAEGKKIATGKFNYIEDSFKNSLKGFKKAPGMVTAKIVGKYLKGNLMEGVQENLQDVISVANEKYYLDSYKNKELGAHLYNRAQSSLMYEGLKGQFSAQGFETFASGALMGMFSGGLNVIKGGLDYGYNNTFNKTKYQEYKALRKTHGEAVANRLTALYSDPKEFFNSRIVNYGVQNNTVSGVDEADTKEGKDELSDAFVSQVHTALDTNTINYFKDHIASFKDTTPEEFEEAFGFEKGTGAKQQEKIDKILTNIDSIDKTYKYANDRFPNPVNLSDYDKASPEYTNAAIFHSAWENAKKSYVFSKHAFTDTTQRMSDISGSIVNNPSMENMSQLDMDLVFQPSRIYNETILLKNEIAGLKDAKDPSNKQQIKEKEDRLGALEKFLDAHSKHDVYHNRSTADAVLEAYKKEANIEELSDEERDLILDKAFGEKNAENEYKANAELEDAYKNYIKTVNGVDKNYIFDNDIDESFEKLLDHYRLGNESKKLVTYINLLHNPQGFMDQVEKAQTWMSDMYNNRKRYYTDMVNSQVGGLENNEALNALANINVFMDLDAFHAYMVDDILPEEFFDESSKQVIPKGSEKYNIALSILALNKRVKSEDVEKPSLEATLQSQVDRLDAQEQAEIDNLEKTETIKIIKEVVAKDKKLTIDDILNDIDDYQYVDAKYDGTDETVTMYYTFDGFHADGPKGKNIDADTIKNKFSEYKIYTKKSEPNAEQVAAIKEKYDALRDNAAEKHADKKAKTKADVYSNYTPVEELPEDLKQQLKDVFFQSETAIQADEDDVSDEELDDIFKVFVKNNSLAKEVFTEYNNKSKDAIEKENLGEIDDFDFVLNNKKLNTSKYSTEDIKQLRKQFEELRDEAEGTLKKTAYQDVITKFNKLISTRDVQNFTPEVQEIIKKLKEGLIAKQSKITKLGEEGYTVDGSILGRVTNFIEPFKSEQYKYAGADEIKKAFDRTIGPAGLSKTTIPSFITQLRLKLHIDSKTGNFGYTDETESIIKKHLDNLLKQQLNRVLFKTKDELLADIQGVVAENAYEASRDGGTYIDDQLRRFFTKGEAPVFDEKKITREAYDNLFGPTSFLKSIKQKIDSGELYTIANNLKVYDVDANVAGEMDLLLIDKEGKLQIIDFKTGTETKWNGFVTQTKSGKNKTEGYTLQQYTYARLLKKMTGLDADINIFPIETTLDENSKKVLTAKTPTNPKLNGIGNWYFPLDPNFAGVKAKIDGAISLEAPSIKVATELNPIYKKQLINLGYPIDAINTLSKEQVTELTQDNVPYSEFKKQSVKVDAMTFGKTAAETVTPTDTEIDIENKRQEINKLKAETNTIYKQLIKNPISVASKGQYAYYINRDGTAKPSVDLQGQVIAVSNNGYKVKKSDGTVSSWINYKTTTSGNNPYNMFSNVELTEDNQAEIQKLESELAVLEKTDKPVEQVTKASELNLQKDDTVIIKEAIKDFAEKGDTLTVLKSDENSVSFTNKGKEKTLTLQELDKHTTTMEILKTEQAESTPEILDAIDKQTITETFNAFDTFINDKDAIAAAIKEADTKSMSEIEDDLLNNLDC